MIGSNKVGVLAMATLLAACTTGGNGSGSVLHDHRQAGARAPGIIDRLEILSTADAFHGAPLPGSGGTWQLITGIVHGRLLPSAPDNAAIADIENAPVDAEGYVSYTTDFVILRPKEASQARRVMFYEVVNRGNKLAMSSLIGASTPVAGRPPDTSFPSLLRMGYTIVWSGWQGDLHQTGKGTTASIGTTFPVAKHKDGSAITGMTREEFVPDVSAGGRTSFRLSYPPASLTDRSEVVFTARQSWYNADGQQDYNTPSAPVTAWHYVSNPNGSVSVNFDPPAAVPGPAGAAPPDAGTIYTFVYRAKDPTVNGIGFAAVRDLVTFLRYKDKDGTGTANPLADMKHAACAAGQSCQPNDSGNFDVVLGQGTSQSGRFLRDFLYQGFNRGTDGKKVFDGVLTVIPGARRTWTNVRFSQIGRWSKQHEDHFMPGDQFPFAYGVTRDPFTGASDGIMKKCLASATCPKIMQIDGSYEWWGGRASLVVTDGVGNDLALPDNVRYYMVAGTQHGGGEGVTTGLYALPRPGSQCQLPGSPVALMPVVRAMIPAMERWVATGTEPPPSSYPTVASGTLVAPGRLVFPSIKDVRMSDSGSGFPAPFSFAYRNMYNQLFVTDYTNAAPKVNLSAQYKILVPQVDKNGNETAGVLVPDVAVPLATYTGWNVRAPGHAAGEACGSSGAAIPLPVDRAARSAGNDFRASLEDLYGGLDDYRTRIRAAGKLLVEKGYLLDLDVDNVFIRNADKVSPVLFPVQ